MLAMTWASRRSRRRPRSRCQTHASAAAPNSSPRAGVSVAWPHRQAVATAGHPFPGAPASRLRVGCCAAPQRDPRHLRCRPDDPARCLRHLHPERRRPPRARAPAPLVHGRRSMGGMRRGMARKGSGQTIAAPIDRCFQRTQTIHDGIEGKRASCGANAR
jgi:hypothetical protein